MFILHEKAETRQERFERLILIHEQSVLSFIYRHVGDVHITQERKQDVMEKAWRTFGGLKNEGSAKAWLFAIAHNDVMDYFSEKKKEPARYEPEGEDGKDFIECLSDKKDEILTILMRKHDCQTLRNVIREMTPCYRSIFLMRQFDRLSLKEIASILHLKYSTVRVYMVRALKEAQELYNRLEKEGVREHETRTSSARRRVDRSRRTV